MSCILCGNEPECWCYDGYTCRACRLEDERDEARDATIERGECADRWHREMRRVQRERDEARAALLHFTAEEIVVLQKQRDEARSVARNLAAIFKTDLSDDWFRDHPWLSEEEKS